MNTDPYTEAYNAFHDEPTDLDFQQVIHGHTHGDYSYIVRTPGLFVCAREVGYHWSDRKLVDDFRESEPSTLLHVTLVAGDLRELLDLIPDYIDTISFQKHGYRVHRMSVNKLKSRLKV